MKSSQAITTDALRAWAETRGAARTWGFGAGGHCAARGWWQASWFPSARSQDLPYGGVGFDDVEDFLDGTEGSILHIAKQCPTETAHIVEGFQEYRELWFG